HRIPSIYFELTPASEFDYYGFIKYNVIEHATSQSDLHMHIERAMSREWKFTEDAIKHFSSTFGTRWENKEGELTAAIIARSLDGNESLIPPPTPLHRGARRDDDSERSSSTGDAPTDRADIGASQHAAR